jgi:hypothetical protein
MLVSDRTEAGPDDVTVVLQRGTRELASLYEQYAYRVYNLALRITCEPDRAARAVERAFLNHVTRRRPEDALIPTTVAVALSEAPERPSPHGAGDEEAEAMLAATATLRPPERAALALVALTEADAAAVARAMGIEVDAADRLVQRAWAGLSEALGGADAQAATAAWLWAEPQNQIWERMYPELYRGLQQEALGAAKSANGGGSRAAPVHKRKVQRGRSRWRRWLRAFAWTLGVLVLLAGIGLAVMRFTGGFGRELADAVGLGAVAGDASAPPAGRPPGTPHGTPPASARPQTPTAAQLEEVRRRQAAAQAKYNRAKHHAKAKPAPDRAKAVREARQRAKALARQRHKASSSQPPRQPAPKATTTPTTPATSTAPTTSTPTTPSGTKPRSPPPGQTNTTPGDAPTPKQAQADCLYDESSGTYVCPG